MMAFKRSSDHLRKEHQDQEEEDIMASTSRKKRIRLCDSGDATNSDDDDDDEEPLSHACVSASSSNSSSDDDDDLEEAESLQEEEEHQEPSHDDSDDDDDDDYSVVPKHVRFATASGSSTGDDGDAVLTRVGPAARHARLAKPQGWWNRQDRTSFLQDCRDHLEEFQEDFPDRVLHFERVRLQCLRGGNGTSQDDDDYPPLVLPGTVRGLEWGLWSSSQQRSDSDNRRQSHVQAVLDLQDELWDQQEDEGPNGSVDNDRLATLLRCKAERSSRGHRLLARLLAKGDEVQNTGINTSSGTNKKRPATTTMMHHRPSTMPPWHQGYQRPQQRLFRSRCTIMPHPN